MTRAISIKLRVRIGGDDGPLMTLRGRETWALLALIAAGERGCTPINTPGARWSGYVHHLRNLGINIETVRERHGGPFAGEHARYVLRSCVAILEQKGTDALSRAARCPFNQASAKTTDGPVSRGRGLRC
jgi:hypothetical protein